MSIATNSAAQALDHIAALAPIAVPNPHPLQFAAAPFSDPSYIGPALTHIVLNGNTILGDTDKIATELDNAFGGKPVSSQLIKDIETEVEARLKVTGHTVVARWQPDDGFPRGVVTIVVSDAGPGEIDAREKTSLFDRLGLANAHAVDPRILAYDLSALNRYPFRQVVATLTPGIAGAPPSVTLSVTRKRPWEVYAGLRYLGSRQVTMRRFYAGGTIGGALGEDSVLSFQGTASPDLALHGNPNPKFGDAVVNYAIPVARHTSLEISFEVDTLKFPVAPVVYRISDLIATAGLRFDLPHLDDPKIASDVRFGVEGKNELAVTLSNNLATGQASSEVYQVYVGYHRGAETASGSHNEFDLLAHLSPGGVDPGNSDAQYRLYNDGRVTKARYAYVYATFDHRQSLTNNLSWHSQVIGQLATTPLPFSEQPGIGSVDLVRGYRFVDGSFDDVLIVRNELSFCGKVCTAAPFIFWDMGSGRDQGLRKTDLDGSIGFGATVKLTEESSLKLYAAHTLLPGQFTAANLEELGADLVFRY